MRLPRFLPPSLFAVIAALAPIPGLAHGPHCHARPADEASARGAPPPAGARYLRSVHTYALPSLTLTDQDGHRVPLSAVLPQDRAVAVDFIFTSCTTLCPVMSATFRGLSQRLGERAKDVTLVSISIDPERDRPQTLKAYAAKFGASPDWRFYTGQPQDIRALLAAFQAFTGDKANHRPVTLIRPAHSESWIRIDGFPSAAALADEFRGPVAEIR